MFYTKRNKTDYEDAVLYEIWKYIPRGFKILICLIKGEHIKGNKSTSSQHTASDELVANF